MQDGSPTYGVQSWGRDASTRHYTMSTISTTSGASIASGLQSTSEIIADISTDTHLDSRDPEFPLNITELPSDNIQSNSRDAEFPVNITKLPSDNIQRGF